jgi:hypothetical protein
MPAPAPEAGVMTFRAPSGQAPGPGAPARGGSARAARR